MKNTEIPTTQQINALKEFAALYGRNWKSALRHAWETGDYGSLQYGDTAALLQQVRNTFGPSWLVRFVICRGVGTVVSSVDRAKEYEVAADIDAQMSGR